MTPTGDTRRTTSARTAAIVVVTVVLLALTCWPATRTPAILTATALSAAAPLLGIRWYHPERRGPWLAVAAMQTSWLDSLSSARIPVLAVGAQTVGIAVAGGLFALLFTRHRRAAPPDRRRTRRETWGRRTDQVVVGAVVLLAVAQSAVTGLNFDTPWATTFAPFDLVLICLLLRFAASRADLGTSMRLLVGGGIGAAVYDALVADSGSRVIGPQAPVNVVWTVAMCLFLAGSLHPSMRTAFTVAGLRRLRSESARLLGLTPLVLVPIALSVLQGGGRLPTAVYLATGALVGALAIARGAQTIRGSEEQARRDPLTGLANRRGLRVAFEDLVPPTTPAGATAGRLAVLDLDDFKHVNDTYGHETGDHLLVAVGLRLVETVGDTGTVSRSGGDEFVLLLSPAAPEVPEILQTAFAAPFVLDGAVTDHPFPVRSSAGWVELTGASELSLALADADIALYVSKGGGRGTATRFAAVQREEVLGQLELGEDLRRLVAGEPGVGELVLLYQPLVDLPTRTVVGCEALLRWQHPTRGLLAPDTFLPIAEAQGQGAALDTWVLHEACRSATHWPAPDWTVSVNLGRSSMVHPELAHRVRDALAAGGLDPRRLHLEITEHDQLPTDAGVATLRTLADAGVGISLDDFGTGYTSLAYLQRYPITVLKLDRSITGADAASGLLTGIVAMAAALDIAVLAEGVETDEQCCRLAGFGIDGGQGWLFGRPVPADRLADLLPARVPVGNPM